MVLRTLTEEAFSMQIDSKRAQYICWFLQVRRELCYPPLCKLTAFSFVTNFVVLGDVLLGESFGRGSSRRAYHSGRNTLSPALRQRANGPEEKSSSR